MPEAIRLRSLSQLAPQDWACSFVIPKYVKRLTTRGRRSQSDLLCYGIPWMFPFSEVNTSGTKLARTVAKSFFKVYKEFAKRDGETIITNHSRPSPRALIATSHRKKETRVQWASIDPSQLVTTDIPNLVVRLLSSRVKHDDAPVSAVSVISNESVEGTLEALGALPRSDEELPLFKGQKHHERNMWRFML